MIIEYTYLDENNEFKSNIIKNNIENTLYENVKYSLPENLRQSYVNYCYNTIWRFHSLENNPTLIVKNNNNKIVRTEYFKNGFNHREDGAAINFDYDPYYAFFLNGKGLNKIIFAEKTNHLICKFCGEFCKQECF